MPLLSLSDLIIYSLCLPQMSWEDARSACFMLAGPDGGSADLPSVHSQAEQELLSARLLSETSLNVWLGLARAGDGAFSWADGSGLGN